MDDGHGQEEYIRQVLEAYRKTPGTMGTVRRADRMLAAQLYQRGVAVTVIENAFVLAAARRLMRPVDAPPLGTIRSLAYFLPVIEEVLIGMKCSLCVAAWTTSNISATNSNGSCRSGSRRVLRNQIPTRAFGADDGKAKRTPAAWIILLALYRFPNTRLRRG